MEKIHTPCQHQSKENWSGHVNFGQIRIQSKEYCSDKEGHFTVESVH